MDEVIVEAKVNAAIAIYEVKIKLLEDLENTGSQNVSGWEEALGKLIGQTVSASQHLALQPKEG